MQFVMGHIVYACLLAIGFSIKWMPSFVMVVMGGLLGSIISIVRFDKALLAFKNTKHIFPRKRFGWRIKTIVGFHIHKGVMLLEWCVLAASNPSDLKQRCQLTNYALPELTRKHGGLLLFSHVGHWGYCTAFYTLEIGPIAVVSPFPPHSLRSNIVEKILQKHHVHLISEARSVFQTVRLLKKKYSIACFLDSPVQKEHGLRLPLFGKPVLTHKLLACLQMRSHQYVFPVSCYRKWHTNTFNISFEGKLKPDMYVLKDYQKQLHDQTMKYQPYIERWIKARPSQSLLDTERF